MPTVTQELVFNALKTVVDPVDGKDIVSLGMISGMVVKDGNVGFAIEIDPKRAEQFEPVRKAAEEAVDAIPGVLSVTAVLTAHNNSSEKAPAEEQKRPTPGRERKMVPGVKHIVAVASGKGGVGKSTVASNLALALSAAGHRVGLLDADIYGPSQPRMMGISGRPQSPDGNRLDPMENYGVKVMSIGFLVPEDTAMIWRGPMVMSALQQLMRDVNWGELDIMIVDMPPGTGDAQLTMAQDVPPGRRRHRLHTAGHCAAGCAQGHQHVPESRSACTRHHREHELLLMPALWRTYRYLQPWRRPRGIRPARRSISWAKFPLISRSGRPRMAASRLWSPTRTARTARFFAEIADRVWDKIEGASAQRTMPKIVMQ